MTRVWQQGEVSWSMVCAACCHMALVSAVMHLNFFLIASVHSFYTFFFNKSGIDKSTEWSTVPVVLALCAFFL